MNTSRPHESGNVFFIILLAIMMFAALSYAIFSGGRQSASSLSGDQARIAAQEIIAYGDTIQKAVQTLRLRGCSMAEISFEEPSQASHEKNGYRFDYINPNSPADGSCHVFNTNGGKVNAHLLTSGYINPSLVTNNTSMAADSFQITMIRMLGAGSEDWTTGTDVVLWLGRLTPEVCIKINSILGIQNTGSLPPVDTYDSGQNTWKGGSYGNGGNPLGDNPLFAGKKAFCSGTDTSGETYTYYQLLYAN